MGSDGGEALRHGLDEGRGGAVWLEWDDYGGECGLLVGFGVRVTTNEATRLQAAHNESISVAFGRQRTMERVQDG